MPRHESPVDDLLTLPNSLKISLKARSSSHLRQMPPGARATAAVGLLTPFHEQVQRAGEEELAAGDDADGAAAPAPFGGKTKEN